MAATNPDALATLFDTRIDEIRFLLRKGGSERDQTFAQAANLKSFGYSVDAVFSQVFGISRGYFGSWIRGVPLPAMLAAKRRLTVDLTPQTLAEFGASYNLSPSAFIAFAEAGVIVVNIRDYDPQNPNARKAIEAYAAADKFGFLPQLFERASKHVYFLATLRDDFFNPLFHGGGSLRESFEEAGQLADAATAAASLAPYSDIFRKAVFRNERPDLTAVRWHWAYATASQRFSKQVDPQLFGKIVEDFEAIVKGSSSEEAADYLTLAVRLRYAHLLTSAPISASFGGVYNLLLDEEAEFLQAVRCGGRLADYEFVQDNFLDTIRTLQLGKLPSDLYEKTPVRYRSILSSSGVQVFVRYNDISYLEHYEDAYHRQQLFSYVLDDDGQDIRNRKLEIEIDKALSERLPAAGVVAHLSAEYSAIALARGERLKRLSQQYQGIELPTLNLLTYRSTPIYEANPKLANVLLRMAAIKKNYPSIGESEDVQRRTYWFPNVFRRPPH
jgi:hypothetical protein